MKTFEVIATSTGHSFGVYTAKSGDAAIAAMLSDAGHKGPADSDVTATEVDVAAKAYAAGGEDGASWAQERLAEYALREEQGDALLSLSVPEQGWDEACINSAGFDVFARVCGLTAAQVEERGDLFFAACTAYNKGAFDNAKLNVEGE